MHNCWRRILIENGRKHEHKRSPQQAASLNNNYSFLTLISLFLCASTFFPRSQMPESTKVKGCLHVTSAFASTSNVMNGFHDTKWRCSHLTCMFACHAENGSDTHSVHLHLPFHSLNAKGNVDTDTHAHIHTNVTCKQSLRKGLPRNQRIGSLNLSYCKLCLLCEEIITN